MGRGRQWLITLHFFLPKCKERKLFKFGSLVNLMQLWSYQRSPGGPEILRVCMPYPQLISPIKVFFHASGSARWSCRNTPHHPYTYIHTLQGSTCSVLNSSDKSFVPSWLQTLWGSKYNPPSQEIPWPQKFNYLSTVEMKAGLKA